MTKKLINSIFIASLFIGLAAGAQAPTLKNVLDDIKIDVGKINSQNDVISSYALRKQILAKITSFTALEIGDLRNQISKIDNLEGDSASLRSQFLSKLGNFNVQVENFNRALGSIKTVEESKALATSLKGWREGYLAETKKMKDWLLYFQISNLASTARERLNRIEKEVNNLPENLADIGQIKDLLASSSSSLGGAEASLNQANMVMNTFYLDFDFRKPSKKDFVEPSSLLAQGLSGLKDVYLSFLEIGLLTNKQ